MTEKNMVKNNPLVRYNGRGRASAALGCCCWDLGGSPAVAVLAEGRDLTGRRRTSIWELREEIEKRRIKVS